MNICCHPYLCSSLCNILLVLWLPLIFFPTSSKQFYYDVYLFSLMFLVLKVGWASCICICFILFTDYLQVGRFRHYIFQIFLCSFSPFFLVLKVIFTVDCLKWFHIQFSSVQLSQSVMSDSLRPHAPPCLSPTPGLYPNPWPLSRWCYSTISSSVVPFSSCLQSFPTSGTFQISQLFTSGDSTVTDFFFY